MKLTYQHNGIYCRDIAEAVRFYEDVLEFKLLYKTVALEGDKPLHMAWLRNAAGVVVELLEQQDKTPLDHTRGSLNHLAFRVDSVDRFAGRLQANGIPIEAGPFEADMLFDRTLTEAERAIFSISGEKGLKMKIMFFRGPGNERFEVVEDNIAPL